MATFCYKLLPAARKGLIARVRRWLDAVETVAKVNSLRLVYLDDLVPLGREVEEVSAYCLEATLEECLAVAT